jgi:hypothetical protein
MSIYHRVHACLDGELSRDHLPGDERAELESLERVLASTAECLRDHPPIDLRMGVLHRLPQAAVPLPRAARARLALRQAWLGFWEPRRVSFQFRPSLALAAFLLVGLLPLGIFSLRAADPAGLAAEVEAHPILVQFRLDASGASSVSLVGSFSGWAPAAALRESAPGVWTATVPLEPGVHDYLFLVDGAEWVADPAAHPVEDDFGGTNSRLLLTAPHSAI